MKSVLKILKKELKDQKETLQFYRILLRDKSNTNELNRYFKHEIFKINKNIESIKKSIEVLKAYKTNTK